MQESDSEESSKSEKPRDDPQKEQKKELSIDDRIDVLHLHFNHKWPVSKLAPCVGLPDHTVHQVVVNFDHSGGLLDSSKFSDSEDSRENKHEGSSKRNGNPTAQQIDSGARESSDSSGGAVQFNWQKWIAQVIDLKAQQMALEKEKGRAKFDKEIKDFAVTFGRANGGHP